jgi:2'-5' RNA ligase
VLYFDEVTEHRVRRAWAALEDHGIRSAGSTHGEDYRPHLTLAIVDADRPGRIAADLRRPLADVAGLPVTLASLGFFLTEVSPAFLSVTATSRLLRLHEDVHAELDQATSWSYYRPGTWVPHCTLAMGATSPTAVARALDSTPLPIQATVSSAQMVRLPPRTGEVAAEAVGGAYPLLSALHRAGPRHRRPRRLLQPLGMG